MEIGSFIELTFPKGKEWYSGEKNIARLNTGRAAIFHATRVLGCNTVYIPFYQCETVALFLEHKGIKVKKYLQDKSFTPNISEIEDNACVLLVNYFGIMSYERMKKMSLRFNKVIIDNSQAFFAKPIIGAINVYSARKFIGAPDGAYVICENADKYCNEYAQGYSSDTSLFLLQRIEYGCEGKTYQNRAKNEERIDTEDILRMSELTHRILDGTQYNEIIQKRKENFIFACDIFKDLNQLDVMQYYDDSCIPMVYPLLIEEDTVQEKLIKAKHFQGHWWHYLLSETDSESFEYWMSRYMVPITIDQRYGKEELIYIRGLL